MISWIFGDLYTPAANQAVDGSCDRSWFGWYCSEAMERLHTDWARSDESDRKKHWSMRYNA